MWRKVLEEEYMRSVFGYVGRGRLAEWREGGTFERRPRQRRKESFSFERRGFSAGRANEEEGFQSQREKESANFWLSTTSGSSLS